MQLLLMLIVIAAAVLSYRVSHRVFARHLRMGSPQLIGVGVAMLTGVSLLCLGEVVVWLVLLPYAALGLSLLLLPMLKWWRRTNAGDKLQQFVAEARRWYEASKDSKPPDRHVGEEFSPDARRSRPARNSSWPHRPPPVS